MYASLPGFYTKIIANYTQARKEELNLSCWYYNGNVSSYVQHVIFAHLPIILVIVWTRFHKDWRVNFVRNPEISE